MTKHKHADLIHAWADGAEIQFYTAGGLWSDTKYPSWDTGVKYRVKPTKPSIDWNAVSSEYNYLVEDKYVGGVLCSRKPSYNFRDGTWYNAGVNISACSFSSYKPGTCSSKDSLVERPQ